MIAITNQKDARAIKNMNFCYLCGIDFTETDARNEDHIPPKAVFRIEDRNFPIKLATHEACHSPLNIEDEVIGQLISLLHGKITPRDNDRLKLKGYHLNSGTGAVVVFDKLKIENLLHRWLKGFYAALYREPSPQETSFDVQAPFPIGAIENRELTAILPLDKFTECLITIKRNRLAKNVDKIVSNNGKLAFECVWDKFSDGSWGCIFFLNLYNWTDLGDAKNFSQRECVGLFRRPDGIKPHNAAQATLLEFSLNKI